MQGDSKKFNRAAAIYEKLIAQKAKENLTSEDKTALFSGVVIAVMSVSVMFDKDNWNSFSKLFSTFLSNSLLLSECQLVCFHGLLLCLEVVEEVGSFALYY